VPEDDPDRDERPLGPPLPPDDRLWRHPSELAWARPDDEEASAPAPAGHPRVWGVALVSGVAGAALAVSIVALVGGLGGDVTERVVERVPAADAPVTLAKDASGVPEIAAMVTPSVVRLDVATPTGSATGSGVVLRSDGTVLTNAHVVEGATSVTIVLPDGTGLPGRVAGSDRLTDVAVVVPDAGHRDATAWVPATLGSAEELAVGQVAIAIGSPLGLSGGPSVTVGVVSGLGRRVAAEGVVLHDLIQTDAPIARGSSGGALCDEAGVVVGITTALAPADAGTTGLGFAIPADVARDVADELLEGEGRVHHSWLGIQGADLAPTESSVPGMADMGGVRVTGVDPAGPAAAAGVVAGDVVVAVDGQRVPTMSDLVVALRAREPGDLVRIDVHRDGDLVRIEVVLAERP
jgi:S1-C subfamily serine protease